MIHYQILFASIVIERAAREDDQQFYLYNILYAKDFNPNLLEYRYYTRGVNQEIIPSMLIDLSKKFYEQLDAKKVSASPEDAPRESRITVYQCPECLSTYDLTQGEPPAGIPAGTAFAQLPDDYRCSLCDEPRHRFVELIRPNSSAAH